MMTGAIEQEVVRVGYLAQTDCAPLVVAAALGFDQQYGIRIALSREPSLAAARDKLVGGALDAAQLPYGVVYGVELGSDGPPCEMAVLMSLSQNGHAVTLSNRLRDLGVHNGDALANFVRHSGEHPHLGQAFPSGSDALWLNYWLAAHGLDPLRDMRVSTVSQQQMVELLAAGQLDGYNAAEPWNARALAAGAGFTVVTSQQIWPDHPGSTLATRREFLAARPHTSDALLMAVLDACRYLDELPDRSGVATMLATEDCLALPAPLIAGRLNGEYFDGRGNQWQDAHALRFHDAGRVNYPYLSDGMWFLTQLRRWGLLNQAPDYLAVAERVHQLERYSKAAHALDVPVPDTPLRSSCLIDGRIWNGLDAATYAEAFAIASRSENKASL